MPMRFGRDAGSRLTTGSANWPSIGPSDHPFTAPRLGVNTGQTEVEAAAEIRALESEARTILAQEYGSKYSNASKIEFGQLPRKARNRILGRIEELRGFSSTSTGAGILDQGFGPSMVRGFSQAEMMGDKPWGRIPSNILGKIRNGEEVTPQDVFYASISVQHDAHGIAEGEAASSLYRISGRQYSQDQLEAIAGHINASARSGKGLIPESYSVFDIESPGLNPEEGISQIALRRFHQGKLQSEVKFDFPNHLMRTGIAGKGMQTPEEMLGIVGGGPSQAAAFKSVLQEMEKGNWNVAGHNIGFDYGMMIPSMKGLKEYDGAVDPEFVRLVDKFEHVFKFETHKVIDTNLISQMLLGDKLALAPELSSRAFGTPHSMENILLQTDVIERMVREGQLTPSQMTTLLKQGTHSADIDVQLEHQVLQYLNDMFLGGREINTSAPVRGAWRRNILKSRPYGPRIELDPGNIHPELAANLHTLGLPNLDQARITPQEQMILMGRLQNFHRYAGTTGQLDLPRAVGMYRHTMSNMFGPGGGFRVDAGASIPSFAEFSKMQQGLSQAGVPFAGLNYIERQATGILGRSAFGSHPSLEGPLGARRQLAAQMGDYLGEAWFKDTRKASMFPSGIISLDPTMLEAIYGEGVGPTRAFSLSPFRRELEEETIGRAGRPATQDVGLMFNFSHGEAGQVELQKLKGFLSDPASIEHWGIDPRLATRMHEKLISEGVRTPIQVASFNEGKGGAAAENLANMLHSLMGISVDTKDQNLGLGVVRLPKALRDTAGPYSSYGPATMMKGFTDSLYHSILGDVGNQQHQVGLLSRMSSAARGEIGRKPYVPPGEAAQAAEEVVTGTSKWARRLTSGREAIDAMNIKAYATEKKVIGAGAVVAGLALGGYYLNKRHQANKKLNETIVEQGYESDYGQKAGSYGSSSYVIPSQVSNAVPFAGNGTDRRSQYMQTAGVVSGADRRKIGHHRMGSDKNSHLF